MACKSSLNIGIVVRPTPEAIARSILDVYENKNKYDELVNRGYEYVKSNMSWKNYAIEMLKIYQSVVANNKYKV
jgi:glycosyltransferase involved in cell wall biosynthesis